MSGAMSAIGPKRTSLVGPKADEVGFDKLPSPTIKLSECLL